MPTWRAFFRRQRYPEQANAVFVAQKSRQTKMYYDGIPLSGGRIACWAFWCIMGVIQNGPLVGAPYSLSSGWVYSGMGVVWHLKSSKALFRSTMPSGIALISSWRSWTYSSHGSGYPTDRWFARNYARVHRFLGWVLIPIGLAALTGFIK
jgi:hypothetical protein